MVSASEEAPEVVFEAYYRAEDAGVEGTRSVYGIIGYSHKNRLLYVVVTDAGETGYPDHLGQTGDFKGEESL